MGRTAPIEQDCIALLELLPVVLLPARRGCLQAYGQLDFEARVKEVIPQNQCPVLFISFLIERMVLLIADKVDPDQIVVSRLGDLIWLAGLKSFQNDILQVF